MKLVEVKIKNFRGYSSEQEISLDLLTVIIGKNDAGKSTILDALDIFFNDSTIEKTDCNVQTKSTDIEISCVFDELPASIIIDEQADTTLRDEYLLRSDGLLEIKKVYDCAAAKGKIANIFAIANHPQNTDIDDLLSLKISDLKTKATKLKIDTKFINLSIKSQIRKAIWSQTANLQLTERPISLKKESAKDAYDQLALQMPIYAIFRSDRPSTDQDAEAQDPLKTAVKAAIKRREAELNNVIADIRKELSIVAEKTVEKIKEMSPELANQLTPEVKNKNWDSLFNISLTGEDQVPLNKRGSGTRRLVLLNFFRAQAEDISAEKGTGIIYAIEEPETSQHPNHQILLIDAFEDLVLQEKCQILITTHNPTLARRVPRENLRFISKNNGKPTVETGSDDSTVAKISSSLGVLADHDVKVFLGVEGKHDINFFKVISNILSKTNPDIPCLQTAEDSGALIFVPLGGSSLELWVSRLQQLNKPEFYITDRDEVPPKNPKYHSYITQWNSRENCKAWVTSHRELENYIHLSILKKEAPGYSGTGAAFDDVPTLFAQAVHEGNPASKPWAEETDEKKKAKSSKAKKHLNTICAQQMTQELLAEVDPCDDIRTWLRAIKHALDKKF